MPNPVIQSQFQSSSKKNQITFFIPVYNEEKNIQATVDTIISATQGEDLDYEILIIDDCSQDNTIEVVRKIIFDKRGVDIRLIENEENRGLGFNYFRGAFFAKYKNYMLVNGDNVEPEEAIKAIISKCGEADMVIPYFGDQENRSKFRKNVSRTFSFLVNLLSGHHIQYYNGPALHLTDNVRFWRAETMGYGYQAEMICRLLHEGASYVEVQVPNTDRQWGFSKAFALSNMFSVANSLFHILWRRMEYGVFHLLKPGVTKLLPKENQDDY